MGLDKSYLEYPLRRYGMDHDRYDWSLMSERQPLVWPDNCKLAFWINISVQFFPLNPESPQPRPPGGMTMPYPDLRHFSLRDYGNRVGIYRILDALEVRNIPASCAVNAQITEYAPYLIQALRDAGVDFLGHGLDMDTPLHSLSEEREREIIRQSVGRLSEASRQDITGWISPGRFESPVTPDLLSEAGIQFFADWVNDDMPYIFKTRNEPLVSMPLPTELEDRFVMMENFHSETSYGEQLKDAFEWMYNDATEENGRIFSLSIHPWVIGQPHRIGVLENFLDYVCQHKGVWFAKPSEIVEIFNKQELIN